MSDNVPERIWSYDVISFEKYDEGLWRSTSDKLYRIEYIRKDISDKHLKEILKPLREAAEMYGTANGNSVVYQGLGKAIKETLERADG